MKKKHIFEFFLIAAFLMPQILLACTTFCLRTEDRIIFGRNYDWSIGDGLVVINKKNTEKKISSSENGVILKWISKHGSISFNQYGIDSPMDGLNEEGLVVAQMWLDNTSYPAPDSRPGVGALTWIQYQLDNSGSVEEVISSDQKLRIDSELAAPLHFLVCDASGQAAVIEFLDEKRVVYTKDSLPYSALTNSTYSDSLQFLKDNKTDPNLLPRFWISNSFVRFSKAANMVDEYNSQHNSQIMDYGFKILDAVRSDSSTQWSIVYDITDLQVEFKTLQSFNRKTVSLKNFRLNCESSIKVLDVNSGHGGGVEGFFVDYTSKINRDLIYSTYKRTSFLQNIPNQILDSIAEYPESFRCIK
ncbi:linear amide C-N hydrolase [bacterium]|nr:linear amide C-N hydrolase [bacterium]